MGLNISKILNASTAHISQRTGWWLEEHEDSDYVIYDKDYYGWFISCTDLDELEDDIPEDLMRVMRVAEANGCDWLNLDGACPIIEGLKTYDWS